MKYIDADKLIAEIERRMKCYDRDGCEPNDGKWVELVTIKHFIEFLQKEQFVEWNEEDEKHKEAIIESIRLVMMECADSESIEKYKDDINWFENLLKSFCSQFHWKPSKEQINALKVVARGYPSDDLNAIESLLNDLQKLM